MNGRTKGKVLVIGLDGARLDIIRKWVGEGHLPNLSSFFEKGVCTNLESVYPIHSIPAWVSFATGKLPVNHGVYDIQIRSGNDNKRVPPNSTDVSGKPFWSVLSDYGRTVGVVNIPVTFPPKQINGIMVSGWVTPSDKHKYAYPKSLWRELQSKNYKTTYHAKPQNQEKFLEEIYELCDKRFNVMMDFMDDYDWDAAVVMDNGTEMLHHHYASFIDPNHLFFDSNYEDMVRGYYNYVDAQIGRLIENAGECTNIFIISDHGFEPFYGKFYINTFFKELGLLKTKDNFRGFMAKFKYKALRFGKKHAKFIYFILPKSLQERALVGVGGIAGMRLEDAIDWDKTKAYCPILNGGIYLNKDILYGDDSKNYDTVRDTIIRQIKKDSRFNGIIKDIVKKEDVYADGKYFEDLPDLYLKFDKRYKLEINPFSTQVLEPLSRFNHPKENIGYHTINGIFMSKGPDIGNFEDVVRPRIVDIAPTILHMLRLPIPKDLDGKVLKEIFDPVSNLSKEPVQFQEGSSEKNLLRSKISTIMDSGRF